MMLATIGHITTLGPGEVALGVRTELATTWQGGKLMTNLVGSQVTFRSRVATVLSYEPLSTAMSDLLIKFSDDGAITWCSSHECRYLDGTKLPRRQDAIDQANKDHIDRLRKTLEDHIYVFEKYGVSKELN